MALEALWPLAAAFWFLVPAYIANSSAVVLGGGTPMDFGRKWPDGKELFGSHKTWRGYFGGIAGGVFWGLLQNIIHPGSFPWAVLIALPAGAMTGDLVKSFFKRRIGIAPGKTFPVADQFDFLLGAWLFAWLADPAWFGLIFAPATVVAALVLTPALHVGVNRVGYLLKLKKEKY
ncbi:MAG: CDP-2,3-bis-(O-geranylgeranyl)-sn-glycerol synthase [Halobacteria archaeon]